MKTENIIYCIIVEYNLRMYVNPPFLGSFKGKLIPVFDSFCCCCASRQNEGCEALRNSSRN